MYTHLEIVTRCRLVVAPRLLLAAGIIFHASFVLAQMAPLNGASIITVPPNTSSVTPTPVTSSSPAISSSNSDSTAGSTIAVTATGIGKDRDSAIKRSLSAAVQQAVGTMVDAETLVKNNDLVKDQILTYSNGFVASHEIVSESKTDDGLYQVTVKAVVKRGQLTEKLRQLNVSTTEVQGQSLFGEVFTKRTERESGSNMLAATLKGLPKSLLLATLVSQKPTILEINESATKASWRITVGFNMTEYYNSFVPRMKKVLQAIAKKSNQTGFYTQGTPSKRSGTAQVVYTIAGDSSSNGLGAISDAREKLHKDKMVAVALNVSTDKTGSNLGWQTYLLDEWQHKEFEKIAQIRPKLRISFLDKDNQLVRAEDINITDRSERLSSTFPWLVITYRQDSYSAHSGFVSLFDRFNNYDRNFAVVWPFLGDQEDYSSTYEFPYTLTLNDDELKRITKVQCGFLDESVLPSGE